MTDQSIPAFPLQWPTGWPRARSRKEGRFVEGRDRSNRGGRWITVADGVTRVCDEFKRYGIPDYNLTIASSPKTRIRTSPAALTRRWPSSTARASRRIRSACK